MTDHSCPACGTSDLMPMVSFGELPVTGVFLSSPHQPFPTRGLAFNYCKYCACVIQVRSEKSGADYSEVGRGTQRQFPAYADDIVAASLTHCASPLDLLIEVGSNDGTFLTHLRTAGIGNLIGVEPSRSLAEQSRQNGHRVENVPLDQDAAIRIQAQHGLAKLVICRHTLEHVPDPYGFMKALRSLLRPDGVLLIEVPSVAPIVDKRLQGYELWDEHLSYFSEENLAALLLRTGFDITDLVTHPHCGSENILCWATPATNNKSNWAPSAKVAQTIAGCESFANRWKERSDQLLKRLRGLPRPVYAMGASHLQTNFLHFTGIIHDVSGLFDDDPYKIGKWVPGSVPIPISSCSRISTAAKNGTVMLSGFGYPNWMESVRQSLEEADICALPCDSFQSWA